MQEHFSDIAIIGGGASGLAAAIEAKRYGGIDCCVALFEKNARLGKKILATGNGRCNLGNVEEKQIRHYTGSCTAQAEALLTQFVGSEKFFRSLGVICKADSGRLYPYSNHAASVLDALRLQLQEIGVETHLETEIFTISYDMVQQRWQLKTSTGEFYAKYVIVSCGGSAAPVMGTDGSFWNVLKGIGHTVNPLTPALCPIYTNAAQLRGLKGIRILAKVSLLNEKGHIIHSDSGEVQLTDKALSGICIFNLAAYATQKNMSIQLDLLPHLTEYEVAELLWNLYAQRAQWKIEDMLSGVFQKKLCPALFRAGGISVSMDAFIYTLTPDDIQQLARTIKTWTFQVEQLGDWRSAQVTAGGISASEIDDNLRSCLCPNLYFAGEVLDIVGECGGFNLAWAWCSGISVARAVIHALKGEHNSND